MRNSLARLLRGSGYSVRVADCAQSALGLAEKRHPDLVLLDVCLPDTNGLDILIRLKEINRRIVVIAMTAYESTKDAVLAIKRGAYDYVCKPFKIAVLKLLIRQALENEKRNNNFGAGTSFQAKAHQKIIGNSPTINRVLDMIKRIPANFTSNILLEGETGTGKELVAHAIHEIYNQSDTPFVAISCGAIPPELMEAELFGYEKGAFTGARPEGKHGILEEAAGGTIFLDEIGDLQFNLQVKLLRVLQEREFNRIGGFKSLPLRCRFIAATNRNLKQDVDSGRFRADLYYRLNVVNITMPPLCERRSDIYLLQLSFDIPEIFLFFIELPARFFFIFLQGCCPLFRYFQSGFRGGAFPFQLQINFFGVLFFRDQ